jgi:hypothetical protein
MHLSRTFLAQDRGGSTQARPPARATRDCRAHSKRTDAAWPRAWASVGTPNPTAANSPGDPTAQRRWRPSDRPGRTPPTPVGSAWTSCIVATGRPVGHRPGDNLEPESVSGFRRQTDGFRPDRRTRANVVERGAQRHLALPSGPPQDLGPRTATMPRSHLASPTGSLTESHVRVSTGSAE